MNRSTEYLPTPEQVLAAAFALPRTPRSDAYKLGALSALKLRMQGTLIAHPYDYGTAEADAFFAGQSEGHSLYGDLQAIR